MNIKIKYIVLSVVITLALISCNERIADNPVPNLAPETHIFIYAKEDSAINKQKSRLQVHWWGDDPDGLVRGFFIKWEGLDTKWTFTERNDSVFSLPIGSADTTYVFKAVAVDEAGNGKYDDSFVQNGTDYGAEPFTDKNGNGVYDEGEEFIDLGLTDPTPAAQIFPIKNSTPEIQWNDLSVLPPHSFPVITVGWNATDLDGDETITQINLALNDTTEFVSLDGYTRLITLRIHDLESALPEFDILIGGSGNKILDSRLGNLVLGGENRLYLQAVDISGAKSYFQPLPDTSATWIIDKPKGNLLIIDDYRNGSSTASFYNQKFDMISGGALVNKYDVFDIENNPLPYPSITLPETVNLFDYIFWYSDSDPDLDLVSLITQPFLSNGGKIAFSMTFKDSSADFNFGVSDLQLFLPVDAFGEKDPLGFLFAGAKINDVTGSGNYPNLKTGTTIGFVRTFVPNSSTADEIYSLDSSQKRGNIAFMDKNKTIFFIGLPLDQCDNKNNVQLLLEQIFINDFGLTR